MFIKTRLEEQDVLGRLKPATALLGSFGDFSLLLCFFTLHSSSLSFYNSKYASPLAIHLAGHSE